MTRTVRHVGIVVEKIDTVLPFYRDLLGLKVIMTAHEPTSFANLLLGLSGCQLVTVKLAADTGPTLIELLEFASPPSSRETIPDLITPGITHVALTVADLDRVYQRMSHEGIAFVSPPLESLDGRVKVAFCRDPAGNYLELVEELS